MRPKCEDFLRIDVRKIDFQRMAGWQYPEPDGIAVYATPDRVHVIHGYADVHVQVLHTRCYYGGLRPWFLCPQCGDRRAVLYDTREGDFGCRRCMRLTYECQTEDVFDRLRRKEHKLAARLGPYWMKPKWMRWSTYDRIIWLRANAEHKALLTAVREFGLGGELG